MATGHGQLFDLVVGVAYGANVRRLPVPCEAAEKCRQCRQQTSVQGDEVGWSRVICAYLEPTPMLGRLHLSIRRG